MIATDLSGQDFFDFKEAPCPHLMTRPPFKKIRRFIDHAFAIGVERIPCAQNVYGRARKVGAFHRHRPARFINLNWREDYLSKADLRSGLSLDGKARTRAAANTRFGLSRMNDDYDWAKDAIASY